MSSRKRESSSASAVREDSVTQFGSISTASTANIKKHRSDVDYPVCGSENSCCYRHKTYKLERWQPANNGGGLGEVDGHPERPYGPDQLG